MTIFSAALLLFLVMDPFGNVPLFLSVLNPIAPERRRRVIIRELLFALAALIIFLFLGPLLLVNMLIAIINFSFGNAMKEVKLKARAPYDFFSFLPWRR